jgi:hypothetical protein
LVPACHTSARKTIQAMSPLASFGDYNFIASQQVAILGAVYVLTEEYPKQRRSEDHGGEKALHGAIAIPWPAQRDRSSIVIRPVMIRRASMIRLNWRKVVAMLNLTALEYRARQGKFILLHENGTLLWRCALPCAGWWRKAQRAPAHSPTQPQSKQTEAALKCQAWGRYRSWSRIPRGVLLSVIGRSSMAPLKSSIKLCPALMPRSGANISIK